MSNSPRRHVVIPDTQIRPDTPLNHLVWIGEYLAEKKPDVIVQIGDWYDMASLSSYEKKGGTYFEGKRYKDDIAAGNLGWELLTKPIAKESNRLRRNKKRLWNPEMHYTLGNHECYDNITEVLTDSGWRLFSNLNVGDTVLTLAEDQSGEWQKVSETHSYNYIGPMYLHDSSTISLCVTPNHRQVYVSNLGRTLLWSTAETSPANCNLFTSAYVDGKVDLTDTQLQFAAIATTDSYHPKYGDKVYFYQSGDKANRIRTIIENVVGNNYSERSRLRDITEICGRTLLKAPKESFDFCMVRPDWCPDSNKELPIWVKDLSEHQASVFLEMLVFCDGSIPTRSTNSRVIYGTKKFCTSVQEMFISKGYRITLSEYRPGHWRANITKTTKCRVEKFFTKTIDYSGKVYCATVPNGTLMTRRNNKPVFSGNSRIERAVKDNAVLEGVIGYDDFAHIGWERHGFLEPVWVDGICYSHYFANPNSGRPYTGMMETRLKNIAHSFVMGHQQVLSIGRRETLAGAHHGLVVGNCYLHSEEYRGPQSNNEWRGICILNEVTNGAYDLCLVSLDYLCRKYEGMNRTEFMGRPELHITYK